MVGGTSRRLALVGSTVLGAAVLGGTALATTAGAPGDWDVVARGKGVPGGSANDLGVVRGPDGVLHVAWSEQTSPSSEAIRERSIRPGGALGATSTIVANWSGVGDPELVWDRGVRAYFSGRRSTDPGDPFAGLVTVTASAPASGWSAPQFVYNGSLSESSRTPSATVLGSGTSLQTWYGASEIHLHRGLDTADSVFTAGESLSEFGPTVVADSAGRVWVAWCGFGRNAGGLFLQRATPAGQPIGGPIRLPGSTTPFSGGQVSTCNLERTVARRTAMVARARGGVFVAGAAGYPNLSKVLVWRIDASGRVPAGAFVVGADNAFSHSTPALAAAPDGRVWVAWLESRPGAPTIAARRSNPAGTEWGEPVRVRAPRPWLTGAINVLAQAGRLDVLGLMQTVGGDHSIQHTQLFPALTLTRAGTARLADGRVVLRVRASDAGDAVAGARVVAAGRGADVTGADGIATFTGSPTESTTLRLTATKPGYVAAHLAVRCC